ncbi:MAG TPA: Rieske (2Fe-2S) protein [Terriglobales bacterium]|jgi:menaquinol-cytochrome c reductase iron-sulfur subunit|nr:Rieske (2Fe-2S) protein [Terriglobales bacterium]
MSPVEIVPRKQTENPGRRSFLAGLLAAGGAAVGALLAVPLVRFALYPVLARTTEKSWSDVGKVDEFQNLTAPIQKLVTIEQRDGWRKTIKQQPVYVTKDPQGGLIVLSAVCTHLGCSVRWVDAQNKFVCPCHGGMFSGDGKLLGGPPPRGLDRLETKIEDGILRTQYQFFRPLIHTKEELA